MKDQMEVCLLSRGVMVPSGATPISLITRELSLPPSSFIRNSVGVPCSSLSLLGELRTYHVPLVCLDGLGSACSPVMLMSPMGETGYPHAHHVPFWFKPVSTFGLFALTTFISSSHVLAIPSNPSAPTTLMLVVITFPRGSVTLYRGATLS
jgi:hypothetical protein